MADEPVDLRELLSKPLGDFPDLPNLPGGKTFYGKLTGLAADHSRNKGTPLFRFGVRLTDPGKDVTREEMDLITTAGFSLADYDTRSEFYLTPAAMKMLRRFLGSLGFAENTSFVEALKLDPATGNPTSDSQEVVRGLDVICRTAKADDQGRVFLNLDFIAGHKRDD